MNTWNDHVRYQRAAFEFMGLPPPPAVLGFDFLAPPVSKVRRCKRPEVQDVPYPEHQRPRPGRPYSMFVRTPLSPAERAYKPEADRILREFEHLRPTDPPDDCRPGMPKAIRPCPWAGCRHHLGITVNDSGSIKVDHGHLDFERLEETCSIDVGQRGKHTQKQVARWVGLQEDWLRKTEVELRAQLLRKVRRQAPLSEWSTPDASGRQTCLNCRGEGEIGDVECGTCDGEGYRWAAAPETAPAPKAAACATTAPAAAPIPAPELRPTPAPAPAARPCAQRRSLPGAKPRSLGVHRLSLRSKREMVADLRKLADEGFYVETKDGKFERGPLFPRVYGDCEKAVPRVLVDGSKGWCPFVSCRMHLKYDIDAVTGAIKDMFPGREPWELEESCALRWVESHRAAEEDSQTPAHALETVGRALNVTFESVRLTAEEAIAKVRRRRARLRRLQLPGGQADDEVGENE